MQRGDATRANDVVQEQYVTNAFLFTVTLVLSTLTTGGGGRETGGILTWVHYCGKGFFSQSWLSVKTFTLYNPPPPVQRHAPASMYNP